MADFTPTVLKNLRELGVSHVWYTGIIRHATMTDYTRFGIPRQHPAVVKGRAGSPYAIADYYDVDPDLAQNVRKRMDEFQRLVARTHRAGLKVVIDFVPNHVAREYRSVAKPEGVRDFGEDDDTTQGFSPQNNFYYCPGQPFSPYLDLYHGELLPYEELPAKATGNDHFDNAPGRNDWYETVKLNYGVDYYAGRIGHFDPIPDTWNKMLDVLLFWAGKGVDAFRCDMVFMVPVEFWRWVIPQVKEKYPDLRFIGEIYDPWLYRDYIAAGFDWLYDKVGMYDTLRDIVCHRRRAADITQQWQAVDDIRQHMLYFPSLPTDARACRHSSSARCWERIPSCSMPARNMVNEAWTRKDSAVTTAVRPSSTIGPSTRFAAPMLANSQPASSRSTNCISASSTSHAQNLPLPKARCSTSCTSTSTSATASMHSCVKRLPPCRGVRGERPCLLS